MLRTVIDGKSYGREAVLAWEAKRAAAVRKKLGLPPSEAPAEQQRAELTRHKLALGHSGLRRILGRGPRLSEKVTRLTLWLSGTGRRFSVCEIEVAKGSAEHFAHWFEARNTLDDEAAMLDACPDHYIIARDDAGRQLVLETTGGSPLPGEFAVDYADVSSLRTRADPAYPHQVAGVARLADGLAIGGVRHQFRQEGEGFRALLTVEFPKRVPSHMIREHCWHLAVEFSNWIEAAAMAE